MSVQGAHRSQKANLRSCTCVQRASAAIRLAGCGPLLFSQNYLKCPKPAAVCCISLVIHERSGDSKDMVDGNLAFCKL